MKNTLPEPKIHCGHMEVAVAKLVGWRQNVIVPNVSWGLGLGHECDVLVLDGKNRFTEIEIKISVPDLKKDFRKPHGHSSAIISRLVYAVHESVLAAALQIVPARFGLIAVKWDDGVGFKARWIRQCRHRANAKPVPAETVSKFMALGCMRIWTLKAALIRKNNEK